ncbi:MAG: hypothetical protein DDT42_00817 [candidate division WS2 bacterium]|uniref:Resolvase/invertase-type recombinase catalytic domain-containing protein n=1 Tax=Psychracetigena formicireducens TaxID=2986056 RepID=A0A9E2BG42_PSYF1|nr:hypothetical protein [Candidatus Psychracetigena formicireducens]
MNEKLRIAIYVRVSTEDQAKGRKCFIDSNDTFRGSEDIQA